MTSISDPEEFCWLCKKKECPCILNSEAPNEALCKRISRLYPTNGDAWQGCGNEGCPIRYHDCCMYERLPFHGKNEASCYIHKWMCGNGVWIPPIPSPKAGKAKAGKAKASKAKASKEKASKVMNDTDDHSSRSEIGGAPDIVVDFEDYLIPVYRYIDSYFKALPSLVGNSQQFVSIVREFSHTNRPLFSEGLTDSVSPLCPLTAPIRLLRALFNIKPSMTLEQGLRQFGEDVIGLEVTPLLRSCLVFLLHHTVSIDNANIDSHNFWPVTVMTESTFDINNLADRQPLVQEMKCKLSKGEIFLTELKLKALGNARIILRAIRPLSTQISNVTNDLFKILYTMYIFGSRLRELPGRCQAIWAFTDENFNPAEHDLADGQCVPEDMSIAIRSKQKILITLMFGVTYCRGREENNGDYRVLCKARVLCRKPWVGYTSGANNASEDEPVDNGDVSEDEDTDVPLRKRRRIF